MSPNTDPTEDELLAMAYADGELSDAATVKFKERLGDEPALGQQVSEYHALEVLARQVAPPEPMDFEWKRLSRDPLQKTGVLLGWIAFIGGALGLSCYGIYAVCYSDIPSLPKALVLSLIGGFLLLFLTTVRARLRTLPYDPYRNIER